MCTCHTTGINHVIVTFAAPGYAGCLTRHGSRGAADSLPTYTKGDGSTGKTGHRSNASAAVTQHHVHASRTINQQCYSDMLRSGSRPSNASLYPGRSGPLPTRTDSGTHECTGELAHRDAILIAEASSPAVPTVYNLQVHAPSTNNHVRATPCSRKVARPTSLRPERRTSY